MAWNRVAGTANNMAGEAREAAGAIFDDARSRTEGLARQAAGLAQDAYGQMQDQMRDGSAVVAGSVRRQPLAAIMLAGAVGGIIGMLLARR